MPFICVLLAFLMCLSAETYAQSGSQYASPRKQEPVSRALQDHSGDRFSPAERNLIRAHLLTKEHALAESGRAKPGPKTLAGNRYKKLPTDWEHTLKIGDSLAYRLYLQAKPLPEDLMKRLPPPPIGSETVRIENKVIRLRSSSRQILDVFDLTFGF